MSGIILGWQCPAKVDPHRIQALFRQITGRYQPLFQDPLEHVGLWNDAQGLMHFDVRADESNLVYAPGQILAYLSGKPTAADSQGRITRTTAESLLARCSGTIVDTTFIRDVNPPFSFAALDLVRSRLLLIHDGLGLDQLFVYRVGKSLVFSNKCWPILRFLNLAPEINIRGWKHWFCVGWFPENETPLEGIQALDRGECLFGDQREIKSLSVDVFSDWLSNPENGDTRHQMVKATEVFNSLIVSSAQRSSSVSADLTGGLDSRAICSAVIANGLNCNFLTGGPALSIDVQIAKRIASQFDLKWDHVAGPSATGKMSDDVIATSFQKMALWSEGMVEPTRYRHFHSTGASATSAAYFSGGGAEISKAHYYGNKYDPRGSFDRCVRSFLKLLRDVQDSILIGDSAFNLSDDVRVRMNDGQRYVLADYELLDYYNLTERARRWKGAHLAASLFDAS
jgi:hypothetical protein